MTKLAKRSISRRTVDALTVDKDTVFWDSEQPGFGVRVYPSGSKHYVVQTRARGKAKRLTVGRHGVITPEEARRRAALIIARIKAGKDPV
ncbi:MAG: Arm DNA-binding domain-containing protein, partial [Rhodospirillaceae bacterium]|nr:Arm DNA-binding domain-containing protein [Rhodospirillaceae bacterium]